VAGKSRYRKESRSGEGMTAENLKNKWAICLGGSASKIPIIESTKTRGLDCCVIDQNPNCVAKNHSDLFLNISTFDSDTIIKQLEKSGIKDNIIILFAYTSLMQAQYSASRISKELNIPGWSKSLLSYAWNKLSFKNLCSEIGILTPESIVSKNTNEIKHFIKEKGKVLYKPISGSVGSESVHIIDSVANLNSTSCKNNSFFLEEFVGNELYSLDGLVIDHKIVFEIITRKYARSGTLVIDGFVVCTNEIIKNTIVTHAKKLIKAMKLNNTFFGFDIMLHNDLFYFIDFGLLLDSEIDRFLSYASIDVFGLFIDYILKLKPIESLRLDRKIAMAFIYSHKKGIIKKLPNLENTNADLRNMVIEFNKNENDEGELRGIVADKIGHIITERTEWSNITTIADQMEKQVIIEKV